MNLEDASVDWNAIETERFWLGVLDILEAGVMPPADKPQPDDAEMADAIEQLKETLGAHSSPGGSVVRRLNRVEYENSVRSVFRVPFSVPAGFPDDQKEHGFDNSAEGLVLSPPLMEQYFNLATEAADQLIFLPKPAAQVEPISVPVKADQFSMNFEGSQLRDGALRLVTRNEVLIRSCAWPTVFEAKHTGTFRIETELSAFKPKNDKPLILEIIRIQSGETFSSLLNKDRLATFEVPADGEKHTFSAEFDLEKGQTVAYYWANASFGWMKAEARDEAGRQIRELFLAEPELYGAWLKIGEFDRQRTPKQTWELLKKTAAAGGAELEKLAAEEPPNRFGATGQNQLMWAFENMLMERGPALDIHGATFFGPTALKESQAVREHRLRSEKFLGESNDPATILEPVLTRAFRRPATEAQVKRYAEIANAHISEGRSFEEGMHLAIRGILCSPNFLYRNHNDGALDEFDLASRLSYFLWTSPPDDRLLKLAAEGQLSDRAVFAQEAARLLDHKKAEEFLRRFVDQWLTLDNLAEIMPDERLIAKWTADDLTAIQEETHLFVRDILRENLQLQTFIDPDFTYVNRRNAPLYGLKGVRETEMKRIDLPADYRNGGILGQASVMMATANGVDTQPVLRGVWLLENVLGTPPPPPPENVPAVEPDTSGATSIRELLERHQADASCAACHRKIDPPGFALENFDPVGRWRDFYPVYEKRADGKVVTKNGMAVDAKAEMEDGTPIDDIADLRRYLTENIDQFSHCLAEKLLIYATGREMSYGDRLEIHNIVERTKTRENGFRDLILEVILSESFSMK